MPERMELNLSDAFMHPDESSGIEFTAIMININYGMNKDFMAVCSTLEEYAIFIDRVCCKYNINTKKLPQTIHAGMHHLREPVLCL